MNQAVKAMEHFGLYENAVFSTKVEELRWDEAARRWILKTDKGDAMKGRFVVMNFGVFAHPKLPEGNPAIQTYEGHLLHTARWDYEYTGGNVLGGLTKLADKKVAIIGTGPTSVQVVPHLGAHAQHLHVFQRTPAS